MSVDAYMNIQLSGTEEFIDGKSTGSLGQVLIRCVGGFFFSLFNFLWVKGAEGREARMLEERRRACLLLKRKEKKIRADFLNPLSPIAPPGRVGKRGVFF